MTAPSAPLKRHLKWLATADMFAQKNSPHPTTKVGAILVDSKGRKITESANRFAHLVDSKPRARYKSGVKSLWFNCAEQMAIMQALRHGKSLKGASLYVTLDPCAVCAGIIAELQLKCVYVPVDSQKRYQKLKAKYKKSIRVGTIKLAEAGIPVVVLETHKKK